MAMDLSFLPKEIIISHIIPYTYKRQSFELCKDIKTYHLTLHKIINLYKLVFSDVIWKQILEIDVNKYYRFKDSQEHIDMDSLYTTRKPINQLWGKMIPVDRLKCFMEKHREFTSNTVVFNG